jgi:hypothetical protein
MKFEYDIVPYPSDRFEHLTYFCTAQGECDLKRVPAKQISEFSELLNEKGAEGWELVQLAFGPDGVVAFWKRQI